MEHLELSDKLTNHLYMSKVSTFQACPMKFYWSHHLHLQSKQRPIYFTFGSAFHKAVEIGLIHGSDAAEAFLQKRADILPLLGVEVTEDTFIPLEGLTEADLSLMLTMLDAFFDKWNSLGIKRVLSTEASVKMHLEGNPYFTDWVVKADFIFEDAFGNFWVGDLKTTSGYGAATAKYYHSSPQTKTYFYILQQHMPNLMGTKIFVVTKQKVRCEEETIVLAEQDKQQARLFIEEAIGSMTHCEDRFNDFNESDQAFPRYMTACINSFGMECPYIPICINRIKSNDYLNDIITNWYKVESPDLHLELKED